MNLFLKTSLFFLFFLFNPALSFSLPDSFTGTVVEVLEGDTIRVLYEGKFVNVRLSSIDSPEKTQAYGKEAASFTAMMAHSGPVRVDVKSVNSLGVVSAEVMLMDAGLSINHELVKAGFAWWRGEDSADRSYRDLEKAAREMKIGLWKEAHPTPPWEFKDKTHGQ